MSKRTLAVLTILLSITAVFFATLWVLTERRYQESSVVADQRSAIRDDSQALHDSLRILEARLSAAESTENQAMLLTETDIRRLKKLGLRDPVTELVQDLVAHPELIPYKAVLGGTMGFGGDRVILLSTRWAFAEFEDGHIAGVCLLEYEVASAGRISWKLLSAALL